MSRFELTRYLDYCSEMLSLTNKLAALYAQNLPDAVVIDAVNDIEQLTTNLSSKIWQKITILDAGGVRGAATSERTASRGIELPHGRLIMPRVWQGDHRHEPASAHHPPGVQQGGGVSNDARVLMLYEANKKTALVAYLLWFFLGLFGGHNFYLGAHRRGGDPTHPVDHSHRPTDHIFWVLVDAFLIPGWVRNQNNLLATQLGA